MLDSNGREVRDLRLREGKDIVDEGDGRRMSITAMLWESVMATRVCLLVEVPLPDSFGRAKIETMEEIDSVEGGDVCNVKSWVDEE